MDYFSQYLRETTNSQVIWIKIVLVQKTILAPSKPESLATFLTGSNNIQRKAAKWPR